MAQLKLKNLAKTYPGNVTAVDSINLEIHDKEFLVLVGPSGCGKSTTLRMIAGLEDISGGDIFIDDVRVNDFEPKDRDIALVLQNYALYPHMNVYKNMAFGLTLRKFSKQEIDQRVRNAAEILGITELLQRRPKALSGGQRQRVAVGRAIVRHPKVFLFDEPLSNLDAKLRVQMRMEIARLHNRLQSTMIYVTHDQVEAMTMGDRIVVMHQGKIQQVDTPMGLYNSPANLFVAGFIGTPPMNFVSGSLIGVGESLHFKAAQSTWEVPPARVKALTEHIGIAVTLGIRPEDIHLGGNRGAILQAKVDVVEPMGSETNVYLNAEGTSFIARLSPDTTPANGDTLSLSIDMAKAHFFDTNTQLRLG